MALASQHKRNTVQHSLRHLPRIRLLTPRLSRSPHILYLTFLFVTAILSPLTCNKISAFLFAVYNSRLVHTSPSFSRVGIAVSFGNFPIYHDVFPVLFSLWSAASLGATRLFGIQADRSDLAGDKLSTSFRGHRTRRPFVHIPHI